MIKERKIIFLGGSHAQVPAICKAKQRGWYVILCDYLLKNPGKEFADEFYNVSTTNREAVLSLTKKLKADYIMAYASDPAAPVAAYVAEQLGLPGNPYDSVQILGEKDLFRAFLRKNGFNAPASVTLYKHENYYHKVASLNFPLLVKPTDSSGSKGITRIESTRNLKEAVDFAFSFSRNNRIIVEELVETNGEQLHGEGFVHEGHLIFCYLGDHHYNKNINPLVPYCTTWPSKYDKETLKKVENELCEIIRLSGFQTGPVNLEIRINTEKKIYVLEIGPRSGGHFIPQSIDYSTGFDMLKASLDILEGKFQFRDTGQREFAACYVIHSEHDGILSGISLDKKILPFVKKFHKYKAVGDKVTSFQQANNALGVLLLQFQNEKEMDRIMENIQRFITIEISYNE